MGKPELVDDFTAREVHDQRLQELARRQAYTFDLHPDSSIASYGWKNVTDSMIDHGHLWAGYREGDRAQRIRGMLKIADRLGYPQNWDLWYYAQPAVYEYVRWESAQPNEENLGPRSRRGRMASQTGGKLPFDGDSGLLHMPWRVYLFRDAAKLCAGKSPFDVDAIMSQQLKCAEGQIQMTFEAIEKEIGRTSSYRSLNSSNISRRSAESLGPLALSFLQHLNALTKDQDSLYSVFRPRDNSFWLSVL
jgi:hypothetical protein